MESHSLVAICSGCTEILPDLESLRSPQTPTATSQGTAPNSKNLPSASRSEPDPLAEYLFKALIPLALLAAMWVAYLLMRL